MSFEALAWAIKQDLKAPDKSVLLMLAYRDNADPPHGCYPSLKKIAFDCGLARSTVQGCLERLSALGLVSRQSRFDAKGDATSNWYSLPEVYREAVHPMPPAGTPVYRQPVTNLKSEPKRESKPRAQSRSARNRFDDELERQRRVQAKTLREAKEEAVRRELAVG